MDKKLAIPVNDGTFKQEVLESDLPVLVDFWADWCGPCRMISPTIEEVASEYKGKIKVCKLNVDEAQKISSEYGIMNIPTLIIFNNSREVDRIVGIISKKDLISKVTSYLA